MLLPRELMDDREKLRPLLLQACHLTNTRMLNILLLSGRRGGEEGRGAMHAMSKKGLEGKEAGHGWKTECQFFFKPTHSSIVTPFRRHKHFNYYFLHFTILHCIESTH